MRIAVVLGTRAELIKMAPILSELKRRRISAELVFTGQHNIDAELRQLGIPKPAHVFDSSASGRGRFASKASAGLWLARAFLWLARSLGRLKPSLVLVHGDTMTTAAGALAAKSRGLKLAHIEAGLRSGSLREPFPEEISRRIADALSDYFFCPTYDAAGNLLAEGKPRSRIFITGNTNIDVVRKLAPCRARRGNYVLAKLHRHENVTSRARVARFLLAIGGSPIPVRLITTENLERALIKFKLKIPGRVRKIGWLPSRKFLSLLAGAKAIVTDAGGETEEAAYLGTPCIQFRERSERREAEAAGAAWRTTDPGRIRGILGSLGRWKKPHNREIFGSGDAGRRIADELSRLV